MPLDRASAATRSCAALARGRAPARRARPRAAAQGQLLAGAARGPRASPRSSGVDVSTRALTDRRPPAAGWTGWASGRRARLTLFQGALTYTDTRLAGLRRRRADGGHRARRPAAAARAGARRSSAHARPGTVRRDHPERRVQRPLRGPRPGMRHPDHRFEWTRAEFAAWAARRGRDGTATRSSVAAVGDDDPEVGPPTQMAVFTYGRMTAHDARRSPSCRLVVLVGVSGSRQVDLRRAGTSSRPQVISSRLLPRPGRRRRERPARHRGRLRRAALHRRQAAARPAGSPSSTPPTCSSTPAQRWSSWPASTTCCRSRSCSTCPRRCASSATPPAPDRDFGRRVVIRASTATCAARCGSSAAEGFRKVHVLRGVEEIDARRRSRTSSRATTDATSPARSTSSATCTAAAPSWRRCSATLGYELSRRRRAARSARATRTGRTAVFVGDLVDRGPDTPGRAAPGDGHGRGRAPRCACPATTRTSCVRTCKGRKVSVTHGLAETLEQLGGRADGVPRRGARRSSTGWSATTCSTAAGWSSRTPGSRRSTTAGRPAGSARSRCTATPPARPTSTACRCATRGPRTTAAAAMVVYGHTPGPRAPSGSTTPSAWTPAASSAAS